LCPRITAWLAPVRVRPDAGQTPAFLSEQIPDRAGFDLEAVWDAEWEKNLKKLK